MATATTTTIRNNSFFAAMSILVLILFVASPTIAQTSMNKTETQIEFYMHDLVKAKNATAVTVAGGHGFGMVRVIDDPITASPSHNSKELGRGRGFYVVDSLMNVDLFMAFTVVFKAGEHSGSTLCLQGQDNTVDKAREIAVVGGTGHFRHATGHVIIQTHLTSGENAILKYSVSVLH